MNALTDYWTKTRSEQNAIKEQTGTINLRPGQKFYEVVGVLSFDAQREVFCDCKWCQGHGPKMKMVTTNVEETVTAVDEEEAKDKARDNALEPGAGEGEKWETCTVTEQKQ